MSIRRFHLFEFHEIFNVVLVKVVGFLSPECNTVNRHDSHDLYET
jgi:hypothetical protein